jgi:hypothetical protein
LKKNTVFILIIALLVISIGSCGGSGSDSSSSSGDAGSSMDELGTIDVSLPKTLSPDEQQATRANVDYATLNDVKSQAFAEFMRNVSEFTDQVDEVNNIIAEVKEMISEGWLKEGETFSETISEEEEEPGTLKFKYKYKYKKKEGQKYLIFRGVHMGTDGRLVFGFYFEMAVDKDDNPLFGQAQMAGDFSHTDEAGNVLESGSYKSKIIFSETSKDQEGFFEFSFTPAGGTTFDEKGAIKIIGDTDDAKNGVYVSTRFESNLWGTSQVLGWANDEYGGIMSHNTFSEGGVSQEDVYTEYFLYDENAMESKIIFRQWGIKDASELFWDIGEARKNISSITHGKNLYNGSVSKPDVITLVYDESGGSYTIYAGDGTGGSVLETGTTPPWVSDIHAYYWLDPAKGTTTSPGDAVYYQVSYLESPALTHTIKYNKMSEVSQPSNYMDKTGFYIEDMYPLKYLTGNHPSFSSQSLIQSQTAPWDENGNGLLDDKLYFIDIDGNTLWDDNQSAFTSGKKGEPQVHAWLPENEMYYDEATDSMKSVPSTPWVFGAIPISDVNSDGTNDITYTYQTQKDTAYNKFKDSTDYITEIKVTPFDISEKEWETFDLSTGF